VEEQISLTGAESEDESRFYLKPLPISEVFNRNVRKFTGFPILSKRFYNPFQHFWHTILVHACVPS